MKKSTFCIILAVVSIVFAANAALSCKIVTAMTGAIVCFSSLLAGAWYEREEKEE